MITNLLGRKLLDSDGKPTGEIVAMWGDDSKPTLTILHDSGTITHCELHEARLYMPKPRKAKDTNGNT